MKRILWVLSACLLGGDLWAVGGVEHARHLQALQQQPISFEENLGQTVPRAKFISQHKSYTAFLASNEVVFSLGVSENRLGNRSGHLKKAEEQQRDPFAIEFVGADPGARSSKLEALPGVVSYFIGEDPSKWVKGVRRFKRVKFDGVYSGIDLVYHSDNGSLEYDFELQPGADPSKIVMRLVDAKSSRLNPRGDISVKLPRGNFKIKPPFAYQWVDGRRQVVESSYELQDDSFTFRLGSYDRSKKLVIDPGLVYSTFLGALNFDEANAIQVDASGNAYVTGMAGSTKFPYVAGSYKTATGTFASNPIFVTKIDPTGSSLIYSAYIGSDWYNSVGNGIAIDTSGNAYVAGWSDNSVIGTTFPLTFGQGSGGPSGGFAVVLKLNSAGTSLLYSCAFNGGSTDVARSISVDSAGNAYVVGDTWSDDFPTTASAFLGSDPSLGNSLSAFVLKLNAAGTALAYSTYLGGTNGYEYGNGIIANGSGEAYICGYSSSTNFPTTIGAYQTSSTSTGAFVSKMNATGSALLSSTLLAGDVQTRAASIDVDGSGNIYVTGEVYGIFPTTGSAIQTSNGGNRDAFVAKLDPSLSTLLYGTYLGGSSGDSATALKVDASGQAVIVGYTDSDNFPALGGSFQTGRAGLRDAFVAKLNSNATALLYSTYFGGTGDEEANALALDGAGDIYFCGGSGSSDLSITSGAYQTSLSNSADAFVVKLNPVIIGTPTYTPTVTPSRTATRTPTPTSTATPANCSRAVVALSANSGNGSWLDSAAATHAYSLVTNFVNADAEDSVATNLADGAGGGVNLTDDLGAGNLTVPVLEVVYRANNLVMRLDLDFNLAGAVISGQAFGGSIVITPPDAAYNTFSYPLTEGAPWTLANLNSVVVLIKARSTGGGPNRNVDIDQIRIRYDPCVLPTVTVSPTFSITRTLTVTPVYSSTPTISPVIGSSTYTPSSTYTLSSTTTATQSPSFTLTRTFTPSPTASRTASPTATSSATPSFSVTPSVTVTAPGTFTHSPTVTPSPSVTLTHSHSPTGTHTLTATPTPTFTNTPSATRTASPTLTPSPTLSFTATYSSTRTASPTPTASPTSTGTPTVTVTATFTYSPTISPTHTFSPTRTPGGYQGPEPPRPGQAFVYPSPARGDTARVAYSMAMGGRVSIRVWNENAGLVDEVSEDKPVGDQFSVLKVSRYAPGVYFYQVVQYYGGRTEKSGILKFTVLR